MKRLIFALAAIAIASAVPAYSEESMWGDFSIVQPDPASHPSPLLITGQNGTEIFRLICLKGSSMLLFWKDGVEIFRMEIADPVGDCAANTGEQR
jgi:hypothetical protein